MNRVYFRTISTCFRPKNQASIDQAPGPIIAKLAPKPQSTMAVQGSADPENTAHNCVVATRSPMYGVPRPTIRRSDAINCTANDAQ